MAIEVFSEIGKLRRVLIHRPGIEIDRMVPAMMERLLFDDILYGQEARNEHTCFRQVLEAVGVEVVDPESLLTDVLVDAAVREELLTELDQRFHIGPKGFEELAELPARELAEALIGGVLADGKIAGDRLRSFYRLAPIPNYFFQRDPQIVLGNLVMVSAMATEAREREPLLAKTIFRHHPQLRGYDALLELPRHLDEDPRRWPSLEGGDLLVASPEILLIGLSERTNTRGIEALARHMHRADSTFRHLIVVELPAQRSYMHLDTVFTFIDHGLCLAYPPVIEPEGAEAGHVYRVDLTASDLAYIVCSSLPKALAELGMEIELVPCGGGLSLIEQQREQWTDGANAFALAPGVIAIYRRNRHTTEELSRRGWRVVVAEDVVAGKEELLDRGPTVVTLPDHELSRARGGPRCMTMPLERAAL